MKFKNNLFLAAAVSLALGAPLAHADTFQFSPTGDGTTTVTVGTIDQAPGNALAVGGVTATQAAAATGTTGQTFQLFYQANLNSFLAPSGSTSAYANGTAASALPYFTFTAAFGERISGFSQSTDSQTGEVVQNAQFRLSSDQTTNYFRIYASATAGNNATGAGFDTGKLIFQGTVTAEPVGNYSATVNQGFLPLDGYVGGTNEYPTTKTVVGGGQTTLMVSFNASKGDFADSLYFPGFGNATITSNFTTNNGSPFNQVDPSLCVASNTGCRPANLGGINGATGPDFLLQADASQVVTARSNPVPEPTTVAMLGLGLAMLGAFAARKKNV